VPAALLMAKLSSDARFCLLTEGDLGRAISQLNDLLYLHTSEMAGSSPWARRCLIRRPRP